MKDLKKAGFTRFVEPCGGEFAMSYLAKRAGFEHIETSDVTLFSTILGYYCAGKTEEDYRALNVMVDGSIHLVNPLEILYTLMVLMNEKKAGIEYFDNILRDMKERKEYHIEKIKKKLDLAKAELSGITYKPMDIFEQIEEIKDDEKAFAIMNLPTYKGGYERSFDTKNRITWNEPKYEIFDPVKGRQELKDKFENSKCLLICYEEMPFGKSIFEPIYVRGNARKNTNVYFSTNKLNLIEQISRKTAILEKEQKLAKLKYPILPSDFVPSETDNIEIIKADEGVCNYYRQLFTHNFVGSSLGAGYAIIINGYFAGVFGYSKVFSTFFTHNIADEEIAESLFLVFGMNTQIDNYRLGRLVTMIACCSEVVNLALNDVEKETYKYISTTQITKYPESKQMRGLMKLVAKKQDSKMKLYRLVYRTNIQKKSKKEVYKEWIKKETTYRALKECGK